MTLIQSTISWEDVESNLAAYSNRIQSIANSTDLVVLPEMFPTGFTMDSVSNAQKMDGPVVRWMKSTSNEIQAAVCGSVIIEDSGNYYNRFIFVQPDGTVSYYDKRHLFRMADENNNFTQGESTEIVEYKGWKLNLQVCYDLRFPVWSRNKYFGDSPEKLEFKYDVLLYVANWPKPRISAWNTLLAARAIENQSYTIGVNRIGVDGKGVEYVGNTRAFDPKGQSILDMKDRDEVQTIELNYKEMDEFRRRFPVGLDAD